MKKFKLSQFLDNLTIFVLIFAIIFIWLRYLIKNLYLSLFISFIVSLFLVLLRISINSKKQAKKKLKKDKEAHIVDCGNTLLFNSFEENCEFFKSMLQHKYNIEVKDGFLLLNKDEINIALFPLFDARKITQDMLMCCLKKVKNLNLTKIIIVCCEYENNIHTICCNYKTPTIVLNKVQAYNEIFCVFNCFPQITSNNKVDEKITFTYICRNAINKRKAKTYFWGGVFLLLSSLIIRYNIYYIIFATVMFVLCLCCVISSRFYKSSKTEIL